MTGLASSRRPAGCASDLALDELRAGDLAGSSREAALRQHLASCSQCHARFEAVRALAAPPASPELRAAAAGVSPSGGSRSLRRLAGGAAGVAAAALVAVLVLRASRPDGEADRTKGDLTLTILIKRGSGQLDLVAGEGKLRPGEEMTFSVQAARPGRVMVVGLDAAPSATMYVPFDVTRAALPIDTADPIALPGSIVADARLGVERVFAVLCPADVPLVAATLRGQAEAALTRAGGHPEAVLALGTACTEASVLLHKETIAP